MSIFIAFHKEYPQLTVDAAYQPLHVGKSLSNKELGFQGDNQGDHISEKNPFYSELTGLYWIWKNTQSDWVGLSHYRRFFFYQSPTLPMKMKKLGEYFIGQGKKRSGIFYSSNRNDAQLILTGDEVKQLFSHCDAIVPMSRKMKYSVWKQYKRRHVMKDLETTQQIIAEIFPSYLSTFNEVVKKKELFSCNMFIMKRKYFNEYMEWLFNILFELEKRIDISNYDNYQKRLFGFVSERLFDVWITHHQVKTKKLPVLYFKSLSFGSLKF